MSNYSSSNEVFGTNILMGAAIIGSVFLLIAVLAEVAPTPKAVTQVSNVPTQELVVVTAPRHSKDS